MSSLWDANYIVVDVETTGTSGEHNRMTEVACVVVQGGEIKHTFTSLINPHQYIPPFIESLTGITNAMVFNAPNENVVLEEVYRLLRLPNAVFVGHNEQFDWSFISHGFIRNGFPVPEIPRLCTCKIARRLLPKDRKKNLGSVAQFYDIKIDDRHRAYGDAEATARILIEFSEIVETHYDISELEDFLSFQNKRLDKFHPPPSVLKRIQPYLDSAPRTSGVYFMHDADDRLLYVGKAKILNERIRSYFLLSATPHSKKISDMIRHVRTIRWEETGSELSALLKESELIKHHLPPYNTVSKKLRRYPFLKLTLQEDYPKVEFCTRIDDDGAEYYGPFTRRGMVEEIMKTIKQMFRLRLCNEMDGPSPDVKPCFYYHINQCDAPCSAQQSKDEYAQEVHAVRAFLSGYNQGLINQLEQEMLACAEALDFEAASILRNRIRELRTLLERPGATTVGESSNAVHDTNVVLLLPTHEDNRTVEVFFVRHGILMHQQIVGRKQGIALLLRKAESLYLKSAQVPLSLTPAQVDQLRIITHWIYRRQHETTIVSLHSAMKSSELREKITNAIRGKEATPPEREYIPLDEYIQS